MWFGEVSVGEAEGAILVHSLRFGKTALRKGRILSAADLADLVAGGIDRITIVRLEPGDIREDPAAARVAAAAAGSGISGASAFTGRANLFADAKGLLVFDRDRLDRFNLVDGSITLGTLPPYAVVEPRQMVATVKIIPFAVPEAAVRHCAEIAAQGEPLLCVAPFRALSVGMIQTRLPGLKDSVLDKTREVTIGRLDALGCHLAFERRCAHRSADLAPEIAAAIADGVDMLLIHGASAIADRRDVIPAGIVAAGGTIDHFGMPVDPGNLCCWGMSRESPCWVCRAAPARQRSTALTGFSNGWSPDCRRDRARSCRWAPAGCSPRSQPAVCRAPRPAPLPPPPPQPPSIAATEAGKPPPGPRIAALLLAAGKSSRMGSNKMLEEIDGRPMVARTAQRLLSSHARPVIAVLGNMADEVDAALGKLPVERVLNADFADGLSTSVKCGIAALPPDIDGVIICLGDMPLITGRDIDKLIAAFNPLEGRAIVVPVRRGKRGNPILWASRFLPEMASLSGDVGARHLITEHAELVTEVEMDSDGVLVDIDTPDALAALRDKIRPGAASAS